MRCAEATSRLLPLQDEFATRFYRWSQDECRHELENDFARVRQVRSSLVLLFLEFADRHTHAEMSALLMGNLKRFSPRAASLLGESISAEEEEMHREFIGYFSEEIVIGGNRVTAFRVPEKEKRLRESEPEAVGTSFVSIAKELRRALEERFRRLGLTPVRRLTAGLAYSEKLGDWYFASSFDMSGKSQLNCGHWLSARSRTDSCPTNLKADMNLLNWCGVHPNTRFDLIATTDIPTVAELVGEIYERMRQSLPTLLDGLRHEIPEELDDAVALRITPSP